MFEAKNNLKNIFHVINQKCTTYIPNDSYRQVMLNESKLYLDIPNKFEWNV